MERRHWRKERIMRDTNIIDHATGIRYGVISQHDVRQAWVDSADPHYGKPTCPQCGKAAEDPPDNVPDDYVQGPGCADWICHACRIVCDSADAYPEQPLGWS